MAEKHFSLSPYNSMGNNPVYYNDPNGDAIGPIGHMAIGAGVGALVGYGAAKLAGKDGKTAGYWAVAGFAIGAGIGAWNPDLLGIFKGKGSGSGDYNFSGMRGGVKNVGGPKETLIERGATMATKAVINKVAEKILEPKRCTDSCNTP